MAGAAHHVVAMVVSEDEDDIAAAILRGQQAWHRGGCGSKKASASDCWHRYDCTFLCPGSVLITLLNETDGGFGESYPVWAD